MSPRRTPLVEKYNNNSNKRLCFVLTFLEALDLLVGEGSAVALQLPLETQPHLRILVARRVMQVRIAVRDVAIVAIHFLVSICSPK